jgi:hypothetical protein
VGAGLLMKIQSFYKIIKGLALRLKLVVNFVFVILQMHRILIPYFLALLVTPATVGLEGTLLVCSC